MKLTMGCFQSTGLVWICLVSGILCAFKEDSMMGRVEEFDAILMRYTYNIAKAKNMESVIKDLEQIDGDVVAESSMKEYYYEVCRGILKEGDHYILSERNRLNAIISGASGGDDGVKETEYAYKRRNILEAFVDAAAQFVMQEFNMDPSEAIKLDSDDLNIQTLHLDDIKFDQTNEGPQTIKLDQSKFKVKTVKKKKPKHDEM